MHASNIAVGRLQYYSIVTERSRTWSALDTLCQAILGKQPGLQVPLLQSGCVGVLLDKYSVVEATCMGSCSNRDCDFLIPIGLSYTHMCVYIYIYIYVPIHVYKYIYIYILTSKHAAPNMSSTCHATSMSALKEFIHIIITCDAWHGYDRMHACMCIHTRDVVIMTRQPRPPAARLHRIM